MRIPRNLEFSNICLFIIVSSILSISYAQNNKDNLRSRLNIDINGPQPNEQISMGQERFALELFHRSLKLVQGKQPRFNFIISPFSIWSLLILITEGANGDTYNQLINVLGLPNDLSHVQEPFRQIQKFLKYNSTFTEIVTAQLLIFDRKIQIEPTFIEKLRSGYEAEAVATDFSMPALALNDVNGFLKRKSNGKLAQVITEKDLHDAQILMLSAIIFDSRWKSPFNSSFTKEESFYDESNNVVGRVNMMHQSGVFPFTAMPELDSLLVELPYGEGSLSMIVILPRKGATLSGVIDKVKSVSLTQMFDALYKAEKDYEDEEVEVYLPKFSVKSELSLQGSLEEMGLLDLFQPEFADLTKISRIPTFISSLIHNVEIRVNEEGTHASAATVAGLTMKATPSKFVANRPFLYIIVEKQTNTLLFIGQIQDPNTIN